MNSDVWHGNFVDFGDFFQILGRKIFWWNIFMWWPHHMNAQTHRDFLSIVSYEKKVMDVWSSIIMRTPKSQFELCKQIFFAENLTKKDDLKIKSFRIFPLFFNFQNVNSIISIDWTIKHRNSPMILKFVFLLDYKFNDNRHLRCARKFSTIVANIRPA